MAAAPPRPVVHCAEIKSGLERPDGTGRTGTADPKRNLGIATGGPESRRSICLMHLRQSAFGRTIELSMRHAAFRSETGNAFRTIKAMMDQSDKRNTIAAAVRIS